MCARYELLTRADKLIERFGLIVPPEEIDRLLDRGEVRPTDFAAVILPDRRIAAACWGLTVSWQAQPVINARAETLESKPTFRPLLEQRCLVPASAYFEWQATGNRKNKVRIAPQADGPFAMAGLFGADSGGRMCFTIVTCPPAAAIAAIHDRMPVLVNHVDANHWLDPSRNFAAVKSLLRPTTDPLTAIDILPVPRQGTLFG